MHHSSALQLESDDPQGAARALLTAIHHINGWPRKPELALQVIEPFQAFGSYRGTTDRRSSMIVSQVCGATGDCYMLMRDVQSAASWYRLAVRFSCDSGYPIAYASLVVEHKLGDHVRTALDALRENREIWGSRPWWLRARDIVLSFAWINKCHPRWIRYEVRNMRLMPKLERLLTGAQ